MGPWDERGGAASPGDIFLMCPFLGGTVMLSTTDLAGV